MTEPLVSMFQGMREHSTSKVQYYLWRSSVGLENIQSLSVEAILMIVTGCISTILMICIVAASYLMGSKVAPVHKYNQIQDHQIDTIYNDDTVVDFNHGEKKSYFEIEIPEDERLAAYTEAREQDVEKIQYEKAREQDGVKIQYAKACLDDEIDDLKDDSTCIRFEDREVDDNYYFDSYRFALTSQDRALDNNSERYRLAVQALHERAMEGSLKTYRLGQTLQQDRPGDGLSSEIPLCTLSSHVSSSPLDLSRSSSQLSNPEIVECSPITTEQEATPSKRILTLLSGDLLPFQEIVSTPGPRESINIFFTPSVLPVCSRTSGPSRVVKLKGLEGPLSAPPAQYMALRTYSGYSTATLTPPVKEIAMFNVTSCT